MVGVLSTVLERKLSKRVSTTTVKPSYEKSLLDLLDVLFSPRKQLISILCSIPVGKEAEILSRSLLHIYENYSTWHYGLYDLLQHATSLEVSSTERIGTLFRSESMATKLLNSFLSRMGNNYLFSVLDAPLKSFFYRKVNLDVDSFKGHSIGDDIQPLLDRMLDQLKGEVTSFLNAILGSVAMCPPSIRIVLGTMCNTAVKKFQNTDETRRIVVAGYLFLRFFCPAIAMPNKYKLGGYGIDTNPALPELAVMRSLLLVAKCLQHIVNGTHFTESHMQSMNPWMREKLDVINSFCSNVTVVADDEMASLNGPSQLTEDEVLTESTIEALMTLHAYVHTYRNVILSKAQINDILVRFLEYSWT
jgi:hypothetical protein